MITVVPGDDTVKVRVRKPDDDEAPADDEVMIAESVLT